MYTIKPYYNFNDVPPPAGVLYSIKPYYDHYCGDSNAIQGSSSTQHQNGTTCRTEQSTNVPHEGPHSSLSARQKTVIDRLESLRSQLANLEIGDGRKKKDSKSPSSTTHYKGFKPPGSNVQSDSGEIVLTVRPTVANGCSILEFCDLLSKKVRDSLSMEIFKHSNVTDTLEPRYSLGQRGKGENKISIILIWKDADPDSPNSDWSCVTGNEKTDGYVAVWQRLLDLGGQNGHSWLEFSQKCRSQAGAEKKILAELEDVLASRPFLEGENEASFLDKLVAFAVLSVVWDEYKSVAFPPNIQGWLNRCLNGKVSPEFCRFRYTMY